MSSFKKNTLAAALVLGMGFAGSAAAYTYLTSGDTTPEMVANFAFDGTTTQSYFPDQTFEVRVDAADLIVGRTSGFTVRVALDNALFNAPLSTVDGAYNGPALPAGWSAQVVFQNTNSAVINVIPDAGNTLGIVPGVIVDIPGLGAGYSLKSVEELATAGGKITGFAFFADAVSATELGGSRKAFTLLESGNPLTRECTPENGDTEKKIDVADTTAVDGFEPKTAFSPDGSIGGSAGAGSEAATFDFGDYSVGVNGAFTFDYLSDDSFVTTLTGPNDFTGFDSIWLTDGTCSSGALLVAGDIDDNEVTFEYTLADVNGDEAGFTVTVCGSVDNDTVILDNDPISISTVATRGENDVTLAGCALLPLKYNGSIVKVYNVNPAGNTTAESFIRVINPSGAAGKVTIVGWDDNGNFRGPLSFNLASKNSRQINSQDIEAGNAAKLITGAFGDGAGKWRLEVIGEFPGMRVSSLNRNSTDGTVTNLTDADGHGEQRHEASFDNN